MSDQPHRILVVEDEEHLAAGLKLNLELEGYEVDLAGTAREAGERLLLTDRYALIVLDVMLPDRSGFELCKKLRDAGNYTPVIMLTARGAAQDRVEGLESGADDYVVKPFELDELLARVGSILRRQAWAQNGGVAPQLTAFGRARVAFDAHEVTVDGRRVELTRLELDLLRYFVANPGRVIGRDELLEKVWKLRSHSSRTIDNFISRLRRHFEDDPTQPRHFLSVRGAGYKFMP
ncbi:MAG: response regulator transcription factor [Sandaracinaceae bacterium]|nr:response regulator transcription factor [Sandaracinaceae bacterium]